MIPWLGRFIRQSNNLYPIRQVASESGISVSVLRKAAQQGRLRAEKRGHFWFSSVDAVNRAIADGKIKAVQQAIAAGKLKNPASGG